MVEVRIISGRGGGGSSGTSPIITLTDAPTITWNASISTRARVTLEGDRTLTIVNTILNIPLLLIVDTSVPGRVLTITNSSAGLVRIRPTSTSIVILPTNLNLIATTLSQNIGDDLIYCLQDVNIFRSSKNTNQPPFLELVYCQQDIALFIPSKDTNQSPLPELIYCTQDLSAL